MVVGQCCVLLQVSSNFEISQNKILNYIPRFRVYVFFFLCEVLKIPSLAVIDHENKPGLETHKNVVYLCLQECTWLYAYEDSAVSRNWKIHSRSVQQTIRQYSGDDSPLHSEQTANSWSRAHVSLTSCH